jgi:hypothetical protein
MPPVVFPELLESIGLVPDPNISSVPAWTQNAARSNRAESPFATANARHAALQAAVAVRMADEGIDYDAAFSKCLRDPALSHITSAMQAAAAPSRRFHSVKSIQYPQMNSIPPPTTPQQRSVLVQNKIADIMRANPTLTYDEAWRTCNASTDMKGVFVAMQRATPNAESDTGTALDTIADQYLYKCVSAALSAANGALAHHVGGLEKSWEELQANPMFAPLVKYYNERQQAEK